MIFGLNAKLQGVPFLHSRQSFKILMVLATPQRSEVLHQGARSMEEVPLRSSKDSEQAVTGKRTSLLTVLLEFVTIGNINVKGHSPVYV